MANTQIMQVLLADDDKDDCDDFIEAFESLKIKALVQTVQDGEALMKYLNNLTNTLPHILFLDINMPKKSGLQCLIEIKKIERLTNLTIVVYSTSSSEEDIEATFLNGANIYLKKPTNLTVLKKTLSHILTLNWQYHTSNLNRSNFLLKL